MEVDAYSALVSGGKKESKTNKKNN